MEAKERKRNMRVNVEKLKLAKLTHGKLKTMANITSLADAIYKALEKQRDKITTWK